MTFPESFKPLVYLKGNPQAGYIAWVHLVLPNNYYIAASHFPPIINPNEPDDVIAQNTHFQLTVRDKIFIEDPDSSPSETQQEEGTVNTYWRKLLPVPLDATREDLVVEIIEYIDTSGNADDKKPKTRGKTKIAFSAADDTDVQA